MKAPIIRRVEPDDLASIYRIELLSFGSDAYPFSYLKLLSMVCRDFFIVAELAGKVIGYAVARVEHRLGHMISIAVVPEHRRQGIASMLMRALLDALSKKGVQRVKLEVRESNVAAQNLYKKMGFRVSGKIERYYGDGETAILMAKELS